MKPRAGASIEYWPGGQLRKGEVPLPIGDRLPRFVGVFPQNLDVDAGQPRTRLIDDDAADRRREVWATASATRKEAEDRESRRVA